MGEAPARRRLSVDDWAAAALTAIAEGGLAAVAVERLATQLRTTKGSFYWHFRNRDALVRAALDRWEQQHTDVIIDAMEQFPDPADRLHRLLRLITEHTHPRPENQIEVALLASASDPAVAAALARVTERRISYVAELFTQLGSDPDRARRQALLAYTAWLGHTQLRHAVPQVLPAADDSRQYFEHLLTSLR